MTPTSLQVAARTASPIREFPKPLQPPPLSRGTLEGLAAFRAGLYGYDPLVALLPTAAEYRERIGRLLINDADAAQVRQLAVEICQDVKDQRTWPAARLAPRVPAQPVKPGHRDQGSGDREHGAGNSEGIRAPDQDVRALICKPREPVLLVGDFTRKTSEGARFFARLPGRIHTGWTVHRDLAYQRRRFVLLCTLAIAGCAALALLLR